MLGILFAIFSPVKRIMSGIWQWVTANPVRIAIVALLALSAFLAISNASLRGDVRHWKKRYTVEATAHIKTVRNFKAAQEQAKQAALVNVERVKAEYEKVNENAKADYTKRLADNRGALDKWMRTKGNRSTTGAVDSSTGTEVPADPVHGTTQAEFLVSADDLNIAADNFSQLTALIAWAEGIGAVDTVNPPAP